MSIGNRIEDMDELVAEVERKGDVFTINMGALRDIYGAGRLGVHVRNGIRNDLAKLGIGHYPFELPESQDQFVRLYRKGTPVGNLVEAVLVVDARHDDQIRQAVEGDQASILDKIRELVCP